jgi:hypothetical protein
VLRSAVTFAPDPIITKVLAGGFLVLAGNHRTWIASHVNDVEILVPSEDVL